MQSAFHRLNRRYHVKIWNKHEKISDDCDESSPTLQEERNDTEEKKKMEVAIKVLLEEHNYFNEVINLILRSKCCIIIFSYTNEQNIHLISDFGLKWEFPYFRNSLQVSQDPHMEMMTIIIAQGWPTCGSQGTCGSLKDYLWLSINVPEFHFHFSAIFLKIIIIPYVFLLRTYVNHFIPL